MAAAYPGLRQNHSYSSNVANTKQAQLTNAYSSLAQELASDQLKVVGGYTLGKVIGEGTFGSVHIASHRLTGMRCAIKKIAKASTPQLTREIHHHRRLHHPHIVHLHEIIATENNIWLVSELCPGGELFDYLVERGRILEGEARRIFGELCTAVGCLHRQGIVHRDLKLENVLLDGELGVKLGDLGFAREYQKGRLMETFCGTTGYASPEMLACKKYQGVETDIWSLGIILYTLLCGGLPFDDDDERVMKDMIIRGEYEEPEWLTEDARSLIRGMLQRDPEKRLTMESILTHPWFKKTIYDNIHNASSTVSIPTSGPTSPVAHPMASTESVLNLSRKRLSTSSVASFPFTPRASSGPQVPLTQEPTQLVTSPEGESEPSETSFEFSGKQSTSGETSPTTAENEDEPDIKRTHSGEASQTERALELAHKNSSEATLRKPDSLRERLARMSLEGPREDDESEGTSRADKRLSASSLPMIDEHSLALPVADHSRTPVRTKRRSLTSQLPLERRLSHHSTSSQWQAFVADDYLALLKAELPPLFSTPSEKLLLERLCDLGFDVGQLMHSVQTDACDSSSATWWILRFKQLERGETDDAVLAKREREARRKDRSRKKGDERERHRAAAATSSTSDPSVRISVFAADRANMTTPELLLPPPVAYANIDRPISGHSTHSVQSAHSTAHSAHSNQLERTASPSTSIPTVVVPSPTQAEQSPSKEPRKPRSQSINMLQRATSMLLPGIRRTDADHKPGEKDSHSPHDKSPHSDQNGQHSQHRDPTPEPADTGKRGDSPTKTINANMLAVPPSSKLTKSDSDPAMLNLTTSNLSGQHLRTPPNQSPTRTRSYTGTSADNADASSSKQGTPTSNPPAAEEKKKDSIWNTFRHLFNEDRRRRKRESLALPKAPPVIPTRSSRPAMGRTTQAPPSASRRTSYEGSRPMYSHRSSSVNSRRSSIASNSVPPEYIINVHDGLSHANLGRRTSGRSARSARSTGTETPGSEREVPSRAGSIHSRRGGSRRSSMRSPTLNSEASSRFRNAPASPLHDYHRRSASGSASTRVRHIKVLHEAKNIHPASVASSVRSNASSRASSIIGRDDESDDDGGPRRTSLSDELGRVRSPLSRVAPIGRGKPPLRDVFSKRGDDDDWISEDDEFAGGLGQGASSASYTTKWNGASVRPGSMDEAGSGSGTPTASRFSNASKQKGADATPSSGSGSASGSGTGGGSGSGSGSGGSGGRGGVGRRGLPATRAAPAQIIEEEEEEEE